MNIVITSHFKCNCINTKMAACFTLSHMSTLFVQQSVQ